MDDPERDNDSVSLDAILELLASRWCRYVLYELRRDDPLASEELVGRVATREYDDPDSDRRETVRAQLHHDVLPKLESHGLVERNADEVANGAHAPLAAPYVEWARESEVDR